MTIGWGWWRARRAHLVAMAFCAIVLVACGSSDSDGVATPSVTEAAGDNPPAPTPTPVVVTLSEIVWTTGVDPATGAPQDNVTSFATTAPVIIAAVQIGSMPAGAELTATWSIDGVEVPEATMRAVTDTAVREGWATFRFTREEGHRFPLGVLEVRVTAPGGNEATGAVDIVLP